jgi:hypothetical protein
MSSAAGTPLRYSWLRNTPCQGRNLIWASSLLLGTSTDPYTWISGLLLVLTLLTQLCKYSRPLRRASMSLPVQGKREDVLLVRCLGVT